MSLSNKRMYSESRRSAEGIYSSAMSAIGGMEVPPQFSLSPPKAEEARDP